MLKPYDRQVTTDGSPASTTDSVRSEFTEASTSTAPLTKQKPRSPRKQRVTKLFVLDTNVLMHDQLGDPFFLRGAGFFLGQGRWGGGFDELAQDIVVVANWTVVNHDLAVIGF